MIPIIEEWKELRPILTKDLIRIGRKGDGGYVINQRAFDYTNVLLSFGINEDWSFEEDFYKKNHQIELHAFDFSINTTYFLIQFLRELTKATSLYAIGQLVSYLINRIRNKGKQHELNIFHAVKYLQLLFSFRSFFRHHIRFYQLGISNHRNSLFITFEDSLQYISSKNLIPLSVFLKVDIEGSEFQIMDDVIKNHQYINTIAIEFHDLNRTWEEFITLIRKLKEYFFITHIHGNNCSSFLQFSNIKIPIAVEITFLNKAIVQEYQCSEHPSQFPIQGIDYPNNMTIPDIEFKV